MWTPFLFSCSTCIHTHRHFKFQFSLALLSTLLLYTPPLQFFFIYFIFDFWFWFSWTFEDFLLDVDLPLSSFPLVPLSNGKRSSAFLNPQFLVLNPPFFPTLCLCLLCLSLYLFLSHTPVLLSTSPQINQKEPRTGEKKSKKAHLILQQTKKRKRKRKEITNIRHLICWN